MDVLIEVRDQIAAHRLVKDDIEATRAEMTREIEAEVLRKIQMLSPDTHLAVATQPAAPVSVGPAGTVAGTFSAKARACRTARSSW